jgi:hypothetical protein
MAAATFVLGATSLRTSSHLPHGDLSRGESGDVAARMRQASNEAADDRVANLDKYDGDAARFLL